MLPKFLRDRHLRRALVLWSILAIAFCVKVVYYSSAETPHDTHTVYPQFAAASRHWWSDQSLYADYWQEGYDGYRYSPTFAVAFTPFTYLTYRAGAVLWGLTSIIALLYAMHRLARDLLPGKWTMRREGIFLTLALPGYAVGLWSGQTNALVSALILLATSAIVRGRWWTAAVLLAMPVFIKLWPIAVVLLLAACWPRQLTWRFAVTCLFLAAVPLATRPWNIVRWQYHEWYLSLTGPLQKRWPGYRDAWTIWDKVWPPVNGRVYAALQLTAAAAVLGWCLWQRRRLLSSQKGTGSVALSSVARKREVSATVPVSFCAAHNGRLLLLIYAIWASWQLLFGPGSEQLTYGILAPATSWALLTSFEEKTARWLTIPAWALSALLASGDIEKAVLAIFARGQILLPLSVVLFVAWLLWHERGLSTEALLRGAPAPKAQFAHGRS
jgi:alpha-1,2-mannosyltransferase